MSTLIKQKVGDTVTYEILDEESYFRGYGLHMEQKTSTIEEIRYSLSNGDTIRESNLRVKIDDPKIGDTVTYEIWDGEEGRGYGWALIQKTAVIRDYHYTLKNRDTRLASTLQRAKE